MFGTFLYKASMPMSKTTELSNNYLKPIVSFKYSPNNTKDISNKDTRLSYDNIFSLNRIGTNEIVEGGKSIALEWNMKLEILIKKLLGLSLANSISQKNNTNLPSKSKLTKNEVML